MSSTSQVALLNNHQSLFASDHQEDQAAQLCPNMAFFSNFPSAATFTSSSSSFQSAHSNIISPTSFSVPNTTDLSSSSSSSVTAGSLLSSSSATAAPLQETPMDVMGAPQILYLNPSRTSLASTNNLW